MRTNFLKKLTAIIASLLLTTHICACDALPKESQSAEIFALNTVINLTAYGDEPEKYLEAGKSEIRRLEALLSTTLSKSDIYRVNASGGEWTEVSDETFELLKRAAEFSALTDERFDPTLLNLTKLWGFGTDNKRVPTEKEIDDTLKTTGVENLAFDENKRVKLTSSAKLDLGAIAKGYIADKAAEAMQDAGMSYGIIDLGGNVRTIGKKQDNSTWKIGVQYPDANNHFLVVECEDISLITSGGYQRNFTENGKTYHHILNPKTGCPAESDIKSVTVIGKDGTLCDALSTALFIGGSDYAEKLYSEHKNFEYIILTQEDKILATAGLKGKLKNESPYENLNITYINGVQ